MYDFNKIKPAVNVSKEWLLSKVNDVEIFTYYHGAFKIGKVYSSVFRRDKNPSAGFFVNKVGRVIYKDFGGDSYSCFAFVQKMFNCSFKDALYKIAEDFGLIDKSTNKVSKQVFIDAASVDTEAKKETIIQFIPDKWTKRHLDYWRLYEVTQEELERENVYPVKQLFINKTEIHNKENELRFAYVVQWEDKTGVKVYSPYSKTLKWLSSIPLNVPFGLHTFDWNANTDTVIVTKSLKDMICLRSIFPAVIGLQNESEGAFPEDLQEKLKERFKNRIVWFDSDEPGVTACKKFNDKGFGYFNIPNHYLQQYGIKDASDYIKFYGRESLIELLKEKKLL